MAITTGGSDYGNIGKPGKFSDDVIDHYGRSVGSWEENGEAIAFVTWWNRVKDKERFMGKDADGKPIPLLGKYDPYTLYPIFYEYAAFRNVDCLDSRLWSEIRILSSGSHYPRYPFYKVWLLYWKVLLGWLCGDRHNGHRLEYARNYH